MLVNNIRKSFIEFFKNNEHLISPSSSLIPTDDDSLLFVNSGMVQFKKYFTNVATPPSPRIASAQKCVRAGGKHNDLDNVGYTARHHTFFEMLGNFSFGDYFKEEAISYAWQFLTSSLEIPKEKLYVTVYHTDDEAIKLWKKIAGLNDSRIIKIETSDNFWQMGDTGPCGPCSEIFYDHGEDIAGGLPGTPEQDGDRYVEIWNLVFTQYDLQKDGSKLILPKKCIDTGSGLERLSAVMQGKHSNYDTDVFQTLMNASKDITRTKDSVAHRVIADHIRASCFLIADGVMPSNEGRGYVMRRIMRRAMRYVHQIGYKDALLYKLVPTLLSEMGEAYPELKRAEAAIISTLRLEEEKFRETLSKGMRLLEDASSNIPSGGQLSGDIAFKLYDTYGFPIDLTRDVLRSKNISIKEDEFEISMQNQKQMAKAAWIGSGDSTSDSVWFSIHEKVGATEFLGYNSTESQSTILAIVVDGIEKESVSNGKAWVVLNQTPFYAESGGQVGDIGYINNNKIIDVKKQFGGLFCHLVEISSELRTGDHVKASIDEKNRKLIMSNHTTAHLLQFALRKILGNHVNQKGSLVNSEKVRFDFSHPKGLSSDEILSVEHLVNQMIMSNHNTDVTITSPEQAIESGAIALFGEKYGDQVRVVKAGDSIELCGGTHVNRTGDIGVFKIISEESISSGVRRIEGYTGIKALEFMNEKQAKLNDALQVMKCLEDELSDKIKLLQSDRKKLEKENADLRIKVIMSEGLNHELIHNNKFITLTLKDFPASELRSLALEIESKNSPCIVILSSENDDKISLMIKVSKDIASNYSAAEILNKLSSTYDLKGGGNQELAQAGGSGDISLKDAINLLR